MTMMEEKIREFSDAMASMCQQLHSNSQLLSLSLSRPPIPVDSASASFLDGVNRRVSAAGDDLNVLESVACGTVSFEELLGHCNELYKKNESDLAQVEAHLRSLGCEPAEVVEDKDELLDIRATAVDSMGQTHGDVTIKELHPSGLDSLKKNILQDALHDSSLSLHNLGLSDSSLARLSSEDTRGSSSYRQNSQHSISFEKKTMQNMSPVSDEPRAKISSMENFEKQDAHKPVESTVKNIIQVPKDDYETLPAHIKGLATWENLQEAVAKINVELSHLPKPETGYILSQDDIASIGLGSKAKAYILQLLRLNRVVVETGGHSTAYRVIDGKL